MPNEPKEEPANEDALKQQQPTAPEASDGELTDDDLKAVSGGLGSREGIIGPTGSCITQLS